MAIKNGDVIDADEHIKNAISMTENMIQITKNAVAGTVTDITRTNAQVDVFSTAAGYNTTIDTGSTDATYDAGSDYYECKDIGAGYVDSVLYTTSKTFGFNIASAIFNGEITTPASTSITLDISTDGGVAYDVSAATVKTIMELDDDDTDLVIRVNLITTDTGATPTISSFGIQLFNT